MATDKRDNNKTASKSRFLAENKEN